MKKLLSTLLISILGLSSLSTARVSGLELERTPIGEQKIILNQESIPSVSAELVESITSIRKAPQIFSDEVARSTDDMLEKLSVLYLAVERAENDLKDNNDIHLSKAIDEMKLDISLLGSDIIKNGAIELTADQVITMFDEVNTGSVSTLSVIGQPKDTVNTKYFMYGPYTIATSAGNCTYYYVTATAMSTKSSMYTSQLVEMKGNKVSTYLNAVVDVYVQKAIGATVGALGWWTNFLPWELLFQSPPSTHYNITADYTIRGDYVTNVKFIWCYSPTINNYYLGVVLNSTSVREEHDEKYVYNGKPYTNKKIKNYTVNCDNYSNVTAITKKYWEGNENVRVEYIKKIDYRLNKNYVKSVYPKYAQAYYNMN